MGYSTEAVSIKQVSWLRDLFVVIMGSILLALCAPFSIKLSFTPVPIALAPQLAIFLGATLGPRRGAAAILGYLFQGAVGLPVFALGKGGWWHLFGPSGGYLFGYVAAAYLTGYLIENMQNKAPLRTFLSLAAGSGVIFLLGVFQLSFYLGLQSALLLGVVPFLIGDFFKLCLVYRGVTFLRKF